MLTILVILTIFMVVAALYAMIMGLITISPILLVIFCLPLLDVILLKSIFSRKKKKK